MAALAAEAGESLSLQTVIQLSTELEALYTLVGFESRSLASIDAHRCLWRQAVDFFQDAASIWQAIPIDGELLAAHRQLLAQLLELSRDRVEFYSVSESERRAVAKLD
jgi:hypothetical protein